MVDLNKIRNPDEFWKKKIGEANKMAGLRWNFNDKSEIGDVIFWLNMAALSWQDN